MVESSRAILLSIPLSLTLTLPAEAAEFTVRSGWPINIPGSSVDGGLVVNMDDDDDLELVQVCGTTVVAFNLDGTAVPGWPRLTSDGTFSAPSFGDIDGDGEGEIVLHSFFFGIRSRIYAFERNGTPVPGFPILIGGSFKSPALADVDGDGDCEIISVHNNSGNGLVTVKQGDGTDVPGWPQSFGEIIGTGAAVGDVDGDGVVEIFACSFYQLFGYRADGTPLPGFPFSPASGQTFSYSTPVLADLDGDGDLEILSATSGEFTVDGRVYALDHDGTTVKGWPRTTDNPVFVPPTVADIDGDGELDVSVADQVLSPILTNFLYAWDRHGAALPGFPVGPLAAMFAQVMVADVDGDEDLELLVDDNRSGNDMLAFHHDGAPVDGWPLFMVGGAFQQSPTFVDLDGDGLLDMVASGNETASQQTYLYLWQTDVPYREDLAPVPTYQYNVRRDGVVPSFTCAEDLDGSGAVDFGDIVAVLGAWGNAGGPEDLDGSGTVDFGDIVRILAAWGAC